MSKCTPKSVEFIREIEKAINRVSGVMEVKVYYDADKWNKRDYVADITIYRNSSYYGKWTSEDTWYLKYLMREAGATNIIGCIRHAIARDYLDLAFDIKKSKLKELGIDISK